MKRVAAAFSAFALIVGCHDAATPAVVATNVDVRDAGAVAPLATTPQPAPSSPWLRVVGPRIMTSEGKPFHGRGASVHDTRSCDSCSWEAPHVDEVLRRIDALVDDWHATFVRVLLESYPDRGPNPGRVHYRNVLEDEAYYQDVLRIAAHASKKRGVYVLLSLWHDPSFGPLGWPTERTRTEWKKLARGLRDVPQVMFGVVNEPEKNENGLLDGEVWTSMNETVAAIRSVEDPAHPHIVTVQGTREWGRVLDYYLAHPITAGGGVNIAYETHVYNRPDRFDELVTRPSAKLPVIIGELGIVNDKGMTMYAEDCSSLMDLAEKLDIPWLAYTFHTNCPPNLLVDKAGSCVVGQKLEPSAWGVLVKDRLSRPW